MRPAVSRLGRAIYGGFFAFSGLNHFRHAEQMRAYAAAKGTPAPGAAVALSGGMMLAGGAAIATGLRVREGAALIAACLVPVTLQIHQYWAVDDEAQRQAEMTNFLKNVALIGAALAFAADASPRAETGWKHVTYPRLSPTELRALPA